MRKKRYYYNSVIYGKRIEIAVSEKTGKTLSGFAEMINMTKATFFRIINGNEQATNFENMQLICSHLEVCIGIIMNEKDCEPKNREISCEEAVRLKATIVKLPDCPPYNK